MNDFAALVVRLAIVLLTTMIIQIELITRTTVFGVRGDLMLGVAAVVGVAVGAEMGAVIAFIAGLLSDLLVTTPFGLNALTYSLVAYGVGTFHRSLVRSGTFTVPMVTVLASAVGAAIFGLMLELLGSIHVLDGKFLRVVIVTALINGAFGGVLLRVLRWATPHDGGRMRA